MWERPDALSSAPNPRLCSPGRRSHGSTRAAWATPPPHATRARVPEPPRTPAAIPSTSRSGRPAAAPDRSHLRVRARHLLLLLHDPRLCRHARAHYRDRPAILSDPDPRAEGHPELPGNRGCSRTARGYRTCVWRRCARARGHPSTSVASQLVSPLQGSRRAPARSRRCVDAIRILASKRTRARRERRLRPRFPPRRGSR
jgi:hypothetical protein